MHPCPAPLLPPVPPPPKLAFDAHTLNGPFDHLASPHRKQLHNRSLWKQLSTAYHYLNACPRPDPRFVPNKRPLDCLEHLRPSIFVTLLPDGYLRHECSPNAAELPPSSPMATMQSPSPDVSASSRNPSPSPNRPANSPKNATINAMPRYPYDRNSKPFLRCLDLGIIPPLEDLPQLSQRHYYDGCLIAEINDLRNEPLPMSKSPRATLSAFCYDPTCPICIKISNKKLPTSNLPLHALSNASS
ncbi:hypothetical protein BWQ96_04621 [Gracilariopsis chorda]|uniref:Uncharacterized protein n=1 Tax=Gracilariopsis chorda TaxID=448386 RepID=A0A2V3IU07_9FLOR|nr:hypothetical protein BWQ96_04621 [Gracilariopsis chorda]|eukprot:PXF45616.1 hypothetical protein BWQ96_04621 [Gracilariopsis chorda]